VDPRAWGVGLMPAGDRFVEVPREALVAFLTERHFTPEVRGREVVYTRRARKCEHLTMLVFTSLSVNAAETRGLGKDAIRVRVHFQRGTFRKFIFTSKSVHRTGSVEGVIARMKDRMLDASREVDQFLAGGGCFECSKKAAPRS